MSENYGLHPSVSPTFSATAYDGPGDPHSFDVERGAPTASAASFADRATSRELTRSIRYGSLGERPSAEESPTRAPRDHTRWRTQYYEEQFAYRDAGSFSRDRVTRVSPVMAELRTNAEIDNVGATVTDLAFHLAGRYQRPESSVFVSIERSPCLLFRSSFESSYVLTITALPVQIQPALNKRNGALIQAFMTELLNVPAERGIIRFQAITEESLCTNGITLLGEIERVAKHHGEDEVGSGLRRALTRSSKGSTNLRRKESLLSQTDTKRETAPYKHGHLSSTIPEDEVVAAHNGKSEGDDLDTDYVPPLDPSRLKKDNSTAARVQGPSSAQEAAPKVTKKKSFMDVFRRHKS